MLELLSFINVSFDLGIKRIKQSDLAVMKFIQQLIYKMMKYLFLLGLLLLTFAVPTEDEVDMKIPGYTNHKWYSGYLDFDTGKFHYVLFQSQNNPAKDPLVVWLNGGPGCSSLLGMVYENGPFVFLENTTQFKINKYAWNMKTNILYITSPGGVGFSTSKRGPKSDDGTVAEDNYKALLKFFQKFSNLKSNDFYITGESYSGIYIPYLSHKIIQMNKKVSSDQKINLKGIMINNACTDPRECWEPGNDLFMGIYQYQNLHVHGYYTDEEYNKITAACMLEYHSEECFQVRMVMDKKFYSTNSSMLNLYAKCLYQKVGVEGQKYMKLPHGKVPLMDQQTICQDMLGSLIFFNDNKIQEALHVDKIKFEPCSDEVGGNYTMFANGSYWLYPILMKQKLRIWILSGDVDNSVPITGTVAWLTKLKQQYSVPVIEEWREFMVPGLWAGEDQPGGMTWKLQGLTFASVRGAGHMVPKDKRQQAAFIFNHFINGQDLPQISS